MRIQLFYKENNPKTIDGKQVDDWTVFDDNNLMLVPENKLDEAIESFQERIAEGRIVDFRIGDKTFPDELTIEDRVQYCEQAIADIAVGGSPNRFLAMMVANEQMVLDEIPVKMRQEVEDFARELCGGSLPQIAE